MSKQKRRGQAQHPAKPVVVPEESGIELPIDAKKAAVILGCHRNRIYELARENKIPNFKVGDHFKFLASALIAWRNQQMHGGQQQPEALTHEGSAA